MISEGELGPEFSESEIEKLSFVKDQADKGKIGGPEDKPNREEWEKPDSAWRDLPAEMKNEALAKLRGGKRGFEQSEGELPSTAKEVQRRIEIVGEGSIEEIFFRTLEKNYPELGISVQPQATDAHGNRIRGAASVQIESEKTTEVYQHQAHISRENQVMRVLAMRNRNKKEAESIGYQLENQGALPSGTTKRVTARLIRAEIDSLKSEDAHWWANEITRLELLIKSSGVEPFSNDELESLMLERVIKPEFGPPRKSTKESV